jgi:alpha-ketoglutarate-dependent dioxygenase FTO
MLNDFNHHHHHAVLAGNTWRYSSTHRVAVTSKDTWEFAWKVCEDGKKAYEKIMDQVNKKKELDPILMRVAAESHLTIEFDWIRMYYIQGQKHADSHHGYWQPRMNQLLERWSYYERSLPIIAGYLVEMESDLGSKNQRSKRMFIWLLDEQIEKRRDYRKRCRSSAYFTLETEERPMELPASDTSIKATELRAALV